MKKIYITIILLLLTILCQNKYQGCTPFGVRLALGRSFIQKSQQMLSIRFNTRLECTQSFVQVKLGKDKKEISCSSNKVWMVFYETYVHHCSINFLKVGDQFQYIVYGLSNIEPKTAYKQQNIKASLLRKSKQLKTLVLGDWGQFYMLKHLGRLDNSFSNLLNSSSKPDLVFMNGDYAYDLHSFFGRNYEDFLGLASQVCAVLPCIFNIGNHQHRLSSYKLFQQSFQSYNLAQKSVTSIDVGAYTLVLADPYHQVYFKRNKNQMLQLVQAELKKAKKNKPIIAATHYQLTCSCSWFSEQLRYNFKELIDMFIDYNVAFYIGAHIHSYQRFYPFNKAGDFDTTKQSPYKLDKQSKHLIAITQGCAGNDQNLQKYRQKSNFTVTFTNKQTGYGIMTVNQRQMRYQHYGSNDWRNPVDMFTIDFEDLLEGASGAEGKSKSKSKQKSGKNLKQTAIQIGETDDNVQQNQSNQQESQQETQSQSTNEQIDALDNENKQNDQTQTEEYDLQSQIKQEDVQQQSVQQEVQQDN